jgi:hypothetical protein
MGQRRHHLRPPRTFDWCLIVAIAALGFIIIVPRLPAISFGERPIADLYNPVTKDMVGILVKIDPIHHFPNGTTSEGWLVRGENGMDVWFPAERFRKVERVNR